MKKLLLLCLFSTASFAQTTNVGRLDAVHPDRGFSGSGTTLHTAVRTGWTLFSDHISSRYFENTSIADSTLTSLTHNLGLLQADFHVTLYTGVGSSKVRVADPAGAGWTIADNTDLILDVTTPGSGGPHDFTIELVSSLGTILLEDGSVSAPGMSYRSEPATGLFRSGTATLNIATGGVTPVSISTAEGVVIDTSVPTDNIEIEFKGAEQADITATEFAGQDLFIIADDLVLLRPGNSTASQFIFNATGQLEGELGLVGTPTYTFDSDENTGIYQAGTDNVGFALGGVAGVIFDRINGIQINTTTFVNNIEMAFTGTESVDIIATATVGQDIFITADDLIILRPGDNGATTQFIFNASGQLEAELGSASSPTYTFDSAENTGMYWAGTNSIGFAAGGVAGVMIDRTLGLKIDTTGFVNNVEIAFTGTESADITALGIAGQDILVIADDTIVFQPGNNGTSTQLILGADGQIEAEGGVFGDPTYTFDGDEDTGMFRGGADTLSFSTAGAAQVTIQSNGDTELSADTTGGCGIGNVCSEAGTTTATCSGATNCATCTVNRMLEMRVGNVVTGSMEILLDPTATGTTTCFVPPLIASTTFTADTDEANGTCGASNPASFGTSSVPIIFSEASGTRMIVQIDAAITVGITMHCAYAYEVL